MLARISIIVVIVVAAATLAIPQARIIARAQIEYMRTGEHTIEPPPLAHPNGALEDDFEANLADAVSRGGKPAPEEEDARGVDVRVAAIIALTRRFPNQPALYAIAASKALERSVHLFRTEEFIVNPKSAGPRPWRDPRPPSAEALREFIVDVETGRHLEPDNGYFALLDCLALLQAHRDKQALAALHAAAQCTDFDEHKRELYDGYGKLCAPADWNNAKMRAYFRNDATMSNEAVWYRDLARNIGAMAVLAEEGGDVPQGTAIRKDLREAGALMTRRSRTFMGGVTGSTMVQMSNASPLGKRLKWTLNPKYQNDAEFWQAMRERAGEQERIYAEFLRSRGDFAGAAEVVALSDEVSATEEMLMNAADMPLDPSATYRHTLGRLSLLLAATAVTAALIFGAWALSYLPAMRGEKPITLAATCALWLAPIAVLSLQQLRSADAPWILAPVAVVALLLSVNARITNRAPLAKSLLRFVGIFASAVLAIDIVCMIANRGAFLLGDMLPTHADWSSGRLVIVAASPGPDDFAPLLPILGVPVIAVIAGFVALVRKRPFAASIVHAARVYGPLVICASAVAYCVLLVPAVHANAAACRAADWQAASEPAYYMAIARQLRR